MNSVGERLRIARDRAGLSLGQVHQYEGIQKGHLSEMERGLKMPTAETIMRLARRYRVSADYLLGLTDDPSPASERKLPAFGVELLEIARRLSPDRREELVRIGEVLLELSEERAEHLRAYDRMMELVEEVGGMEAVEALEAALRAHAAGDAALAEQLIDAFFAGRRVKEARQETSEQG